MYGYAGRILEIDLTARTSEAVPLDAADAAGFIGGAGLNAWLLFRRLTPTITAESAENPLIFGAGPLVGSSFPTSARSAFTALSPLTGAFGDSNGGGHLGVMVKGAGYDHIVITGRSETPCYIYLGPGGECEIMDADPVWGLDTEETDAALRELHPKSSVACIGPAGENGVRYASIQFEQNSHSFSRAGMGAVMGGKNLKALVVTPKGGAKPPVHDAQALDQVAESIKQCARELPFPQLFTRYGTSMFINLIQSLDLLYGRNWRRKTEHEDIVPLDVASYLDCVESKSHGCYRCPLKCGKKWRIADGRHKGEEGFKYEVAYIMTLGMTLGLKDVPAILHCINRLNRAGIDVNEFCGVVGMATDAYQKGIINKGVTDGIELDWGSEEACVALIDKVARKDGFGAVLAEGTQKAAAAIGNGAEQYALHMKGMHWPAHSAPPFVMAFSVSTRGGDFLKAMPHLILQATGKETCGKLFGAEKETMDIYSHEKKGRAVWWHENYKILLDCLGVCFYLGQTHLAHGRMLPSELARAFSAATGLEMDGRGLQKAAERAVQVERAINAYMGLARKDDSFTRRPEKDSWARGVDLDRPGMLDEYYAYRGLSANGLPTLERLRDVGLEEAVPVLWEHNVLDSWDSPEPYRNVDDLIADPAPEDIGNGLKARIQRFIGGRVMQRLGADPLAYREHFRRQGEKVRRSGRSAQQ